MRYRILSAEERITEIPQDLIDAFEHVVSDWTTHADDDGEDSIIRLEFDDVDEAQQWMSAFRIYCKQRPGTRYTVRKARQISTSPQTDTSFDIRLREYVEPEVPQKIMEHRPDSPESGGPGGPAGFIRQGSRRRI